MINVENVLREMSERSFNKEYEQFIDAWLIEQGKDPYLGETETEYKRAMDFLSQRLDAAQGRELSKLEKLFKERQSYALRCCFYYGLYAAFDHFFDEESADDQAFHHLVEDGLMTIPGMKRHTTYHEAADKCLAVLKHLSKALDHEGGEHLTSVESAWEERIHGTALASYYCGYRAGLSVLEKVMPMKTLHMIGHLLMTEYELGLTTTYQQRERQRA